MPIGSSMQAQLIVHFMFYDSHRVGYGLRAFLDTVVGYSTCKYLGNYLNGKYNRHARWYLSLKEKKNMSRYF